jgi:short-subunit dehydrogenase
MKLSGKTVVITGAGNGMGRQMVLESLRRGANVYGIDMSESALEATAAAAGKGAKFSYSTVDITDRTAVSALPSKVLAAFGAIDVLVNNAGIIQPFVKVNELSLKDADHVMNVNFFGPLNMIKAFLPELLKRPAAQIANVSSMGGYGPVPGQTVYGASKAAVKLLTEGLRSELLSSKVAVTLIYPGAVGTDIASNSHVTIDMPTGADMPSIKMTSVENAGRIMIDGIEAGKARVFVGNDAKMMDLLVRLMPVKPAELIAKQMAGLLKD